ncbi:helix-turn-helix transcriptional regulator (plasmid) [Photobacterium sp. GJ3]|uniref:helix-turn-helix transcriptional regulator n=1 Tax=Photobacterium sp. GJ3 TaxID=2829502 RepID=UPI001B8B6DD1|nr:AraC family transcriptional regulator [Photobacterium sp. GJ3]QUJ69574.1 helix-turn-helix transcriptional regulator [Photobacterium sp. GJ3]
MAKLIQNGGQGDRVSSDNRQQNETLLEGTFHYSQFRNGLIVQAGTFYEIAQADVLAKAGPCVCVTLLLSGCIGFGYDGQDHLLDASKGAKAMAVNLARECAFRRHIETSQTKIRKVNLLLRPEWFEKSHLQLPESVRQYLQTHLATWCWEPDSQQLAWCEEMLVAETIADPWVRELMLESRAQLIMLDLCRQLAACAPETFGCEAQSLLRVPDSLSGVVAYLESNLHHDIRLQEVATATAMSVSVLQRRFKQELGFTVLDYVRNRRLEKARELMRQENLSVCEAAYFCRYNHPSNFITAFKRKFGMTPGECGVGSEPTTRTG